MTDDELLQPSVPRERVRGKKPWRLQSQFWVAFFGGIFSIFVIAWLNSTRLGVPRAKRIWMIVLTAIAAAVLLGLWTQQPAEPAFLKFARTSNMRIAGRVTAVVLYLALAALQRPDDARYGVFSGDYASLWNAGIAALLLGVIQNPGLPAIVWFLR